MRRSAQRSNAVGLDTRVVVPAAVLFRELAGESVLLELASESYFSLDEVGTAMWRALIQQAPLGSALEQRLARYDVDRETQTRGLIGLAQRLVDHGLLELGDR